VSGRALLIFAVVSVLSGGAFLLIKLAVTDLGPVVVAACRTALGAAVLLPIAHRRGALAGLRGRGRALLALGALEFAVPFVLVAAGEVRIASSLAGVLMAAGPLLIALLALRVDPSERIDRRTFAGLVVGLAGVVCLLGLEVGGSAREVAGGLLVLAGSLSFSAGALLIRRAFGDDPALGVAAAGLGVGAVLLLVPAVLTLPAAAPSGGAVAAVLALGLVQTSATYGLFFLLVQELGAGRATLTTYVAPAIAVALGVALNGEPLTATLVLGLALVLTGSRLASRPRS
jgi:drug/metabolite transporter (DMT)-like permease